MSQSIGMQPESQYFALQSFTKAFPNDESIGVEQKFCFELVYAGIHGSERVLFGESWTHSMYWLFSTGSLGF